MGDKTRARNRSRKQHEAFLQNLEDRVRSGDMSADEAIGIAQGMREFDAGHVKSLEQIRKELEGQVK
jgi:hypothetical protein